MFCTGPCGCDLPTTCFYTRSNGKPRSECKECTKTRNRTVKRQDPVGERGRLRAWRARNPDRRKAQEARWRAANPAKVKARNAQRHQLRDTLTAQDRTYIAVLMNDPCVYCGAAMAHLDHITPVASGGTSHWDNLTAACASCNWGKAAKPLLHYLVAR